MVAQARCLVWLFGADAFVTLISELVTAAERWHILYHDNVPSDLLPRNISDDSVKGKRFLCLIPTAFSDKNNCCFCACTGCTMVL